MKIGIVVNSSWNIYNFRLGLIESLINSGHRVVAIAPNDGYTEKIIAAGCQYQEVEMDCKGSNPLKDLILTKNLHQIYKKQKLDAILHYTIKPNIYGTIAAKLANIPCINNVTGLGTVFIRQNLTSRIAEMLYKISFKFPEVVFFQNEDDQQLFVERKLVDLNITQILPGSGIDVQRFQPAPPSQNTVFNFLMIARVLYDKGILEYIEAIKILKKEGIKAKFSLLGKIDPDKNLGVPESQVQAWVAEGLIDYLSPVENVIPIIQKADCVLLPSYREGTPRTLIEAASLGKPIIATDVAGCRETVKENVNGFLCQAKDARDLAEKMKKMLFLKPEDRLKMGENSRKLAVKKFDQNIVFKKYKEALSKVGGEQAPVLEPRKKLQPQEII